MQNKVRLAIVLILIGAAFAVYNARQAGDGSIRFKVDDNIAFGFGTTRPSSYGVVKSFLDDNPDIDTIVLQNMPGTVDSGTNLKIARLIRQRGIKTHLNRRSFIASGAVDLFIAGRQRTMDCGARIGVHSWSVGSGNFRISPKDMQRDEHRPQHEKFLSDMDIDPAFYVFTREASEPESVHIMTNEEIAYYGLLTKPVDCGSYYQRE